MFGAPGLKVAFFVCFLVGRSLRGAGYMVFGVTGTWGLMAATFRVLHGSVRVPGKGSELSDGLRKL